MKEELFLELRREPGRENRLDMVISQLLPGTEVPLDADKLSSEVLLRAREGDRVAFTHLFQVYHVQIFTYLVRMVNSWEEGEDLTQETFIKAWQSLSSLRDESCLKAWLCRIATRIALDHLRHRKGRQIFRFLSLTDMAPAFEQEETREPGLEEQVAESEQVQQALQCVSQQYRTCLLLYYGIGFKQHEIAAMLMMSEKNVNVYIKRGCEQFRQAYQQLEKGQASTSKRRGRLR